MELEKKSPNRWNRTTLTQISYRFEACTTDHYGSAGQREGKIRQYLKLGASQICRHQRYLLENL